MTAQKPRKETPGERTPRSPHATPAIGDRTSLCTSRPVARHLWRTRLPPESGTDGGDSHPTQFRGAGDRKLPDQKLFSAVTVGFGLLSTDLSPLCRPSSPVSTQVSSFRRCAGPGRTGHVPSHRSAHAVSLFVASRMTGARRPPNPEHREGEQGDQGRHPSRSSGSKVGGLKTGIRSCQRSAT